MKILALINQKGGVGKTTSAVTLGHGLALRGRRVLLTDLDAQGNVADALGLNKTPGLQALIDGAGADAVTPSGRENLDVVVSERETTIEARDKLIGVPLGELRLSARLGELTGYDVALLDVAPGVDIFHVGALIVADAFLIPVKLDHLAAVGATDVLRSALDLPELGGGRARFLGVLPTFWDRTTKESHEQLKLLASKFNGLLWPPIPVDTKAREAPAYGQTLWEYAPKCRALHGLMIDLNGGARLVGGYARALEKLVRELEL